MRSASTPSPSHRSVVVTGDSLAPAPALAVGAALDAGATGGAAVGMVAGLGTCIGIGSGAAVGDGATTLVCVIICDLLGSASARDEDEEDDGYTGRNIADEVDEDEDEDEEDEDHSLA
jgi:hypothetical protein